MLLSLSISLSVSLSFVSLDDVVVVSVVVILLFRELSILLSLKDSLHYVSRDIAFVAAVTHHPLERIPLTPTVPVGNCNRNRCWSGDPASFSGAVEADDEALCDYECAGDDTLRCGGCPYADVYRARATD